MNLQPQHQSFWSDQALKNVESAGQLKLISIEHEQAQVVQANSYLATIFHERLRKLFSLPFKRVDNSFFNFILIKICP